MKPFKKLTDKLAGLRKSKPEIGSTAEDGSIYLGKYKGKHWFAAAGDAQDESGKRLQTSFNNAAAYVKSLDAHGHNDWVLPGKKLLIRMRENQDTGAFKDTYEKSPYYPESHYWTSKQYKDVGTRKINLGVLKVDLDLNQPATALTVNFNTECIPTTRFPTNSPDCTFSTRAVRSVAKLSK